MKNKKYLIAVTFALAAALLTGCGSVKSSAETGHATLVKETTSVSETLSVSTEAISDPITVEEAVSSGTEPESDEILIALSDSEGSVRITEAGIYRLTGSLSNGQVVIEAPEDAKVKLILDGVSIRCEGHAAIYAISADKVIVASAEGSTNLLESVGDFVQTDDNNVDAAIFAKCDLNLNGDGTIGIRCETGHGVVSKDDLKVKEGTVSIKAAGQGLSGKDSVTIEGGTISIVSGTDGIHSENEDTEKGSIEILGGSVYIQSGTDGVDASASILVDGCNLTAVSGSRNCSDSCKGLKADADITVNVGVLTVASYDDAIHANGSVTVNGGEMNLASADDGIHADSELVINDGQVTVSQSYEGLEAQVITINGGVISIVASDDGLNAAGGNDGSNARGPRGGDPFASDANAILTINGGTLSVNANGDGLDSNGQLIVTGGTVYVSGPTSGGNGALDYGISASISGGTVIAAGSSGMAENFGASSAQGSILLNVGNQAAGTTVTITDDSGKDLASFSPEKSYQTVVISAEGMTLGATYTVTAGSYSETVTLNSLIVGNGMGGQMGGGPGGQGGFGEGPGGRR